MTSLTHVYSVEVTFVGASVIPVQIDPVFANRSLPLGYLTIAPGLRGFDFYYLPNADPTVIA